MKACLCYCWGESFWFRIDYGTFNVHSTASVGWLHHEYSRADRNRTVFSLCAFKSNVYTTTQSKRKRSAFTQHSEVRVASRRRTCPAINKWPFAKPPAKKEERLIFTAISDCYDEKKPCSSRLQKYVFVRPSTYDNSNYNSMIYFTLYTKHNTLICI